MWEYVLDSLKRRYQRREGVEEEDIQALQLLHRFGGNVAVIGQVGGIRKTKPVDGAPAVHQSQWLKPQAE